MVHSSQVKVVKLLQRLRVAKWALVLLSSRKFGPGWNLVMTDVRVRQPLSYLRLTRPKDSPERIQDSLRVLHGLASWFQYQYLTKLNIVFSECSNTGLRGGD